MACPFGWHALFAFFLWVRPCKYKLCLMMRRWHHGTTPQYLALHRAPVSEIASWQHLRSAASHQLTMPPHRQITYGGRAFAVAGTSTWNSLLKRLRDPSSVLAVFSKHSFSQSTNVSSALKALTMMRNIKPRFTLLSDHCRIKREGGGHRPPRRPNA